MSVGAKLESGSQQQVITGTELLFSSGLGNSGLPVRGLLCSVLVHLLVGWLGFYLPWSYWIPSTARLVTTESTLHQHEVLFLPDLRPMSGSGAPSGESSQSRKASAPSATPSSAAGIVYKGEQLIVSNPPHPDNFMQTIRQPDLVTPPKLPRPLPFPPMIAMAPAIALPSAAMPQLPAITDHRTAPRSPDVLTIHPLAPQLAVETPKLVLPPMESGPAVTIESSAAKPIPAAAVPQHGNSTSAAGSDARTILVIDAVEVPSRAVLSVPPGELYGAFTVTPGPIPSSSGKVVPGAMSGGSGSGTGASTGSGTGTGSDANATGTGTGTGAGRGDSGTGTFAGMGHGTGSAGNGSGKGNGNGKGNGSGNGNAIGSGRGSGVGDGNSPFSDIVIQGGSGSGQRNIALAPAPSSSNKQSSYGITIVANGASGGGFKDFGVFQNEAAYTVYIDMSDAGTRANWTLQYALDTRAAGATAIRSRSLLVPPYATSKLLPHFSAEAANRNHGSVIVVFGVINSHGNFEGLRVMQSPDPGFNKLLLDSLARWTFRPAEMDGAAVPVKVLLGVPVSSVPQNASTPSTGSIRDRPR